MKNKGKITQVISAVVDVEFENGEMPSIYNALECVNNGKKLVNCVFVIFGYSLCGKKLGINFNNSFVVKDDVLVPYP